MISSRRFRNQGGRTVPHSPANGRGCTEIGQGYPRELKAETTAAFSIPRTNVDTHFKVHCVTLGIGQTTILQDLQQHIEHGVGFRFRQTAPLYRDCADGFGQLTTFVIPT